MAQLSSPITGRKKTTSTTWHVTFEDGGWCKLTIDDKTVMFASDVINGQSSWTAQEDVRDFLVKINDIHYIAKNLFGREKCDVFDQQATTSAVCIKIIEARDRGELTEEEAESLSEDAKRLGPDMHISDELWKFLGGEPWYDLKYTASGGWRRATEMYLPALLSTMRET